MEVQWLTWKCPKCFHWGSEQFQGEWRCSYWFNSVGKNHTKKKRLLWKHYNVWTQILGWRPRCSGSWPTGSCELLLPLFFKAESSEMWSAEIPSRWSEIDEDVFLLLPQLFIVWPKQLLQQRRLTRVGIKSIRLLVFARFSLSLWRSLNLLRLGNVRCWHFGTTWSN